MRWGQILSHPTTGTHWPYQQSPGTARQGSLSRAGKDRDQGKELGSFLGQTCRVVRFGCGKYPTGLVAGWSTAGASQDRTWRRGCGDTRARPRRYTGLVAGWSTAGAPKTGLGGRSRFWVW